MFASRQQQSEERSRVTAKPLIVVRGLTVTSPTGTVLVENANFSINDQSKTALVGDNGSGKSTILKVLAGSKEISVEAGSVEFPQKGKLIEYIPQHPPEEILELSLADAVIQYLEKRTSAYAEDWKAYAILGDMGFPASSLDTKVKNLSGGEVNLLLLARALVTEPALLLLDEPTNHLDTEGIYLFERALSTLKVPFLMVSHDRELLDRFTDQTLFLKYQKIQRFELPYSHAKEELQKQRNALEELRRQQERRRDQIEARVRWLQTWAKMSDDMAQVYRAQCTKLERFEREMVDLPKERAKKITLNAATFDAQTAVQVKDFTVTIPETERVLFKVRGLVVGPGERVAIMGPNGSGKSTFIHHLVDAWRNPESNAAAGSGIRLNPQVKIGYYDQEQRSLKPEDALVDFLARQATLRQEEAHRLLVGAGFPYHRHQDKVKNLSGGERARLLFLAINTGGTNFLILDEPTNHLDVQGIEKLEEELQDFEGTVLFVSHDRRFLENVGTTFYLIKKDTLEMVGGPEDYYSYLKTISPADEEVSEPAKQISKKEKASTSAAPRTRDELYRAWYELEERRKDLNPTSKEWGAVNTEIERLEKEIDSQEQK